MPGVRGLARWRACRGTAPRRLFRGAGTAPRRSGGGGGVAGEVVVEVAVEASLRAQDREMCEKVIGLCGNAGYMVINVEE